MITGAGEGPGYPERVLLVGFMACGKTLVGRALAETLGWTFRDFDEEISAKVGLSISEIFHQHGEGFFRVEEERIGTKLLLERGVVLASGGGWPTTSGRMESLDPSTFSVWLQVTAEESVRRAGNDGATRPLLALEDPMAGARALLKRREPFYEKAEVAMNTTGAEPVELAHLIKDLMNEKGRESQRPLSLYK